MRTYSEATLALMVAVLLAAAVQQASADPPSRPDSAQAPVLRYIGVSGCASCHKSKATGNQIAAWKSTAHARAYETLGTPAAREVAKKLGIDKDPSETPRCLVCHTTAAGELKSRLTDNFDPAEGVQCEACHGPGSEYSKIQHMIKHETALRAGLQVPGATTCTRCHNADSPTFKGFDYATALKKIAHPLAPL